ncbi:hypothetical protein [Pseudomonas mucidolens]|uniref:Uncharacterized protein n=1 Tax=Pseudomonas mucidolens TaxID=46679 RepID=A0A1H2MPX4_9PSED|nr:hypothetical protein [Pseudomonas mucidolens]SDU95114.1 hypothetical protein SAMN05216202_2131 [Pseudomonas mucidolens]SQH33471.1 Uncharacterised protein [Pseudomonas mucidolens]
MTSIPALPPAPFGFPKSADPGSCAQVSAVAGDFPALLKEQCQTTNNPPRPDVGHANTCRNAYIVGVPFECVVPASLTALAQPASVLTWIPTAVVRAPTPPRVQPSHKRNPATPDFNLFE